MSSLPSALCMDVQTDGDRAQASQFYPSFCLDSRGQGLQQKHYLTSVYLTLWNTLGVVIAVAIILILQKRKLRQGEVQYLAEAHTTHKWES